MDNRTIESFLEEELPVKGKLYDFYDYFERLLAVRNPFTDEVRSGDILKTEVGRINSESPTDSQKLIAEAQTTYRRVVHEVMTRVGNKLGELNLPQLDHLLEGITIGDIIIGDSVIEAARKRDDDPPFYDKLHAQATYCRKLIAATRIGSYKTMFKEIGYDTISQYDAANRDYERACIIVGQEPNSRLQKEALLRAAKNEARSIMTTPLKKSDYQINYVNREREQPVQNAPGETLKYKESVPVGVLCEPLERLLRVFERVGVKKLIREFNSLKADYTTLSYLSQVESNHKEFFGDDPANRLAVSSRHLSTYTQLMEMVK